jgi:hypothetical protein
MPLPQHGKSAAPIDRDRVGAQIRAWQDRVLDLTKSNPLIGLNRSRVSKLRVTAPDAQTLFKSAVVDEATVLLPLIRKRDQGVDAEPEFLPLESEPHLIVECGDLTFDMKPIDLMRALKRIYDNARTTVEERGVTTLHLAFGALRWHDDLFGDSVSPLWMVPCELESKGPNAALRLRMADEDPQANPALEYCLRERHKVRLPEIPEEPDAKTLPRLIQSVRAAVREHGWEVTEDVWLSTFSFESLVIYRDLQNLADAASHHPVIAALARAIPVSGGSEALPSDLDTLSTPNAVPTPVLSTDSSQLEALTVAAASRHVVVHGPPGTGKSQTIANLIADALSKNRKVLFVSAKMAALNVVHDRLKELGLQRFCLEAHSTKAGKQKIVDELRRSLEQGAAGDTDALERELQGLQRVREQLNAYARDLHKRIEPLGMSAYSANGRLAALQNAPDIRCALPWPNPVSVSREDFDERLDALQQLAEHADVFDQGAAHPWYGFQAATLGVADEESLEGTLDELRRQTEEISNAATQLRALIREADDLSLSDWSALRPALMAISEVGVRLPFGWSGKPPEELQGRASVLQEASENRAILDDLRRRLRELTTRTPGDLLGVLGDVRDRFGAWYAPLRPGYRTWRHTARGVLRSNVRFSRTLCRAILADGESALRARQEITDRRRRFTTG